MISQHELNQAINQHAVNHSKYLRRDAVLDTRMDFFGAGLKANIVYMIVCWFIEPSDTWIIVSTILIIIISVVLSVTLVQRALAQRNHLKKQDAITAFIRTALEQSKSKGSQ